MSREWKPGDVAIAYDDDWSIRVVRHSGSPDYWSAANGVWPPGVRDDLLAYRPLVVIDPEDREQVGLIVDAYVDIMQADGRSGDKRGAVLKMQAALRSIVTPPRCGAALNIKGEHIGCDKDPGHDDQVHANREHEAIWQGWPL